MERYICVCIYSDSSHPLLTFKLTCSGIKCHSTLLCSRAKWTGWLHGCVSAVRVWQWEDYRCTDEDSHELLCGSAQQLISIKKMLLFFVFSHSCAEVLAISVLCDSHGNQCEAEHRWDFSMTSAPRCQCSGWLRQRPIVSETEQSTSPRLRRRETQAVGGSLSTSHNDGCILTVGQ